MLQIIKGVRAYAVVNPDKKLRTFVTSTLDLAFQCIREQGLASDPPFFPLKYEQFDVVASSPLDDPYEAFPEYFI